MRKIQIASMMALALIGQQARAQQTDYELGQIVVKRKSMMFDFQTAYWTLLAVKNGESVDYEAAAVAARFIGETMPQFVALMEPGTAQGEAPGSRAKPEVWTDAGGFAAAAENLPAKAVALADASAAASAESYSMAFDEFNQACTTCHGLRPSSGGPFRFAKDQ